MKLNPEFVIHTMDDVTLLVPDADTAFHGVVQGNKSVKVILECPEQGADEESIVRTLCDRFDGDPKEMRADAVISRLRKIGAITEE